MPMQLTPPQPPSVKRKTGIFFRNLNFDRLKPKQAGGQLHANVIDKGGVLTLCVGFKPFLRWEFPFA